MKSRHDRRRFLGYCAGAAGAALFPSAGVLRAEERKKEDGRFGGWPIGIQSYSLRMFETVDAVRHIEGLGLGYVEMYRKHLDPAASDEQIARRAGIRNLTANPQPDSFDSLDKLCAEYKVRICIHNHGPGALYDELEDVQRAVEGRHKLIGACIDTGHVIRSGQDPVKWIHELGPRVFALHLKDVAEPQARTHDVVIGTAHLDLVGTFKGLRKIGFPADGSLSLEYESNPDNPIEDIQQCLVAAREAIAKAAG
jgi:inosose dehydratase